MYLCVWGQYGGKTMIYILRSNNVEFANIFTTVLSTYMYMSLLNYSHLAVNFSLSAQLALLDLDKLFCYFYNKVHSEHCTYSKTINTTFNP